MGFRLVSSAWVDEVTAECESYKKGMENMAKAHERMLKQYTALKESKDREIMKLHEEIEALKSQIADDRRENKRLRQAVKYYEVLKTVEVRK